MTATVANPIDPATTPGVKHEDTASLGSSTSFDPTDLQYQADKNFFPDKESLYKQSMDQDGWMHAHNAIRAELVMVKECFQAVTSRGAKTLSEWEVHSLKKVCEGHFETIHAHHANEDKILTPKLLARVNYPDKLTNDHEGIVAQLKVLEKLVTGLKEGDDTAQAMSAFLKEWEIYAEDLKPHLIEEEEIGLPLVRAYFTPKEYGAMTQEIIKCAPPLDLGGVIYHMGKDRFRSEFMKQEGIPFFVWYLVFGSAVKLYEKEVVQHADALKSGVEPSTTKTGPLGCMR